VVIVSAADRIPGANKRGRYFLNPTDQSKSPFLRLDNCCIQIHVSRDRSTAADVFPSEDIGVAKVVGVFEAFASA
jgi:hypothetical protein